MTEDMAWFLMSHQSGVSPGGCPRSSSAQQSEVLVISLGGSHLPKERASKLELNREGEFGAVLSCRRVAHCFLPPSSSLLLSAPKKAWEKDF